MVGVGNQVDIDGAGQVGLPVAGDFGVRGEAEEDAGEERGDDEGRKGATNPTVRECGVAPGG